MTDSALRFQEEWFYNQKMKKKTNKLLNKLIPLTEELTEIEVPLFASPVSAGFPAEAYNYTEESIDFNKLLIKSKETTFCLIVEGDSMEGDCIFPGDLLVVDKLEEPFEDSILIFSINGEFTMKRLRYGEDHVALVSSNPKYKPMIIQPGEELKRWGVLKHVIKKF